MGLSLKPQHLKRYKDVALLLIKYGRRDLVNVAGLDPVLDEDGAHVAGEAAHGAEGVHAAPEHAGHVEHDESAPPPPINWWHGFLGEKADVPPSALWRAPGEPAPFLASLFNFAALVAFAVIVGSSFAASFTESVLAPAGIA